MDKRKTPELLKKPKATKRRKKEPEIVDAEIVESETLALQPYKRKEPERKVSDVVRANLSLWRKRRNFTQIDFARAIKVFDAETKKWGPLSRPAYNRRETGKSPFSLKDLDQIIDSFKDQGLTPEELFKGVAGPQLENGIVLNEKARFQFEGLDQIVMSANKMAQRDLQPEDLNLLQTLFEFAMKKLPLGEKIGLYPEDADDLDAAQ
jgi:transcriptional regulator with XRE-family HTH domain